MQCLGDLAEPVQVGIISDLVDVSFHFYHPKRLGTCQLDNRVETFTGQSIHDSVVSAAA